jgi:hypothetical protein
MFSHIVLIQQMMTNHYLLQDALIEASIEKSLHCPVTTILTRQRCNALHYHMPNPRQQCFRHLLQKVV